MTDPQKSSFLSHLAQSFREHIFFFFATTSYAFLITGMALYYHAPAHEIISTMLSTLGAISSLIIALLIGNIIISLYKGIPKPIQIFKEIELRIDHILSKKNLAQCLTILLCIYPFFWAFLVQKSLIPRIAPYSLDPLFSNIDHFIHGGFYPHQLLPSLSNGDWIISFSLQIYYIWFLVILGVNTFGFFFDQDSKRRKTYLWASFFTWLLLGDLLATALSSAGPIFYGDFYPALINPYTQIHNDMMATKIHGNDLWSTTISTLLDFYNNTSILDMNGITAMPSMHVAATFLSCLYAFSINRILGIIGTIYTLLILICSVILGFHYAIDGYVSIICVTLIWLLCKKFNKI